MISPPVLMLMGRPNACIGCRLPEPAISNPTRFIRRDIELIICPLCERDYFEWCGEDLTETVARSECDPRELVFWGHRRQ
jgi:hypothetical protein